MTPVRSVLLVSLAIAVPGCGGGSDPASFTADANAACKERIDAIETAIDGPDDELAAAVADAYEAELDDLRGLDAPSGSSGPYEQMLDHYDDGTKAAREFADLRVEAEQSTDRETFNERIAQVDQANTASRRARARGNTIAKDIGLDTCGTPLY